MNKGRTILVVDDEEIVRELLEYALTDEGFHVITAENGFKAIDMLSDRSTKCDLAIIDFSMPGIDGIELCRMISELRPDQRLMLVTGSYSTEEEISDMKKNGIREVIRKPFNLPEIISLLKNELGCA